MPNQSFKSPITEHVKNILRGRKSWGLKHPLQQVWAQMRAGQNALAAPVAVPGPSKKRARAMRIFGP